MFELSRELIETVPILTDMEIYFLRNIVPILLLMPWILYLLYRILMWVVQLFQSNNSKASFEKDMSWIQNLSTPPERALSLREIEKLAETDPRKSVMELSRYLRVSCLPIRFRPYSLEFYAKSTKKHTDLFLSIIGLFYDRRFISSDKVLPIIKEVRDQNWGGKDGI